MKCLNPLCDADLIEENDNFCYKCGHPTTLGLAYLNKEENVSKITNGEIVKQDNKFKILIFIFVLFIITFLLFSALKGDKMFDSLFYLEKKINNYIYGYNTSIIKTDNTYNKIKVNNLFEAEKIIKEDFSNQTWKCQYDYNILKIQNEIENNYSILSVNLCDVSLDEVIKIREVIDKIYVLFPNIRGYLTNITVTNAKTNSEYIAYFNPMYQFVNPNLDINKYNKVNKTQILLNSYYYLNDDKLNQKIENLNIENSYVKDATINSILAHEFGHYITFVSFLKYKNIDSITFVTKENEDNINNLIKEYESNNFINNLLNKSLIRYNNKYKYNLNMEEFASLISDYASLKNNKNQLNTPEIIAEAIHDYYLHGDDANKTSLEIINTLKELL